MLLDLILVGPAGLDGWEVLRRIKEDPTTTNVPVIILSNQPEKEIADKVKRLGADGYIVKAIFLPREVVEREREFLAVSGARTI